MLKRIREPKAPSLRGRSVRVAVVASEYNRKHVEGLLQGARLGLEKADIAVDVVRVPGAFEIPLAAELVAAEGEVAAIICLGVIIRGETAHADLVGEAVTRALMEIGLRHRIPVIHEVLLVGTMAQADARCLDSRHNRGLEAAGAALSMVRWMSRHKAKRVAE